MDYKQTGYLAAYGLVAAFIILGMLVVCIPRPRKAEYVDPETAAKLKKKRKKAKIAAKAKKAKEKLQKKKAKKRKKKRKPIKKA